MLLAHKLHRSLKRFLTILWAYCIIKKNLFLVSKQSCWGLAIRIWPDKECLSSVVHNGSKDSLCGIQTEKQK